MRIFSLLRALLRGGVVHVHTHVQQTYPPIEPTPPAVLQDEHTANHYWWQGYTTGAVLWLVVGFGLGVLLAPFFLK